MNDTDKVIIALGFFTLVGFLAYCVVLVNSGGSINLNRPTDYVTVAEFKKVREEMRRGQ